MSLRELAGYSPLGCDGMFLLGGVFSAQFGMASVYGAVAGLSVAQISTFVATFFVGAVVLQYPIGWVSDRMDRRLLILATAALGGAAALTYAAEHITSGDDALTLMAGVDTQVVHGFVNCGATGAITGIGNALPGPVLRLVELCVQAQGGDVEADRRARELGEALTVLSTFDEGPDLVLYYKYFLELEGDARYRLHFNRTDELSPSQRAFARAQYERFQAWWSAWDGR